MKSVIHEESQRVSRFSQIVKEGMKRICADFSQEANLRGFLHPKNRTWVRLNDTCAEVIYFHRRGSTYGAPQTASIDIRVMLSIRVLNAPVTSGAIGIISDQARRSTGYAYHHRFNTETGSTYYRCLEELGLYMDEIAEPWFEKWRDPENLLTHSDLDGEARTGLTLTISGNSIPETVSTTLKALGVRARS